MSGRFSRKVDLECGLTDAAGDLLLLDLAVEDLQHCPDAYEFFNIKRPEKSSRLISEEQIKVFYRVRQLLRDDIEEVSKAFYGAEDPLP